MTDTAAKRRSAAGLYPLFGVTPDATKPQAWRQDAGWGYYGILVEEPSVVLSGLGFAVIGAKSVDCATNVSSVIASTVSQKVELTYMETTAGDAWVTTSGEFMVTV